VPHRLSIPSWVNLRLHEINPVTYRPWQKGAMGEEERSQFIWVNAFDAWVLCARVVPIGLKEKNSGIGVRPFI